MKTMTLRLLFTVAILAGLATAPDAQTRGPQRGSRAGVETRGPQRGSRAGVETRGPQRGSRAGVEMFRWEPNSRVDVSERVERALERAQRAANLAARSAERRAAVIERQVRARVQRQVKAPVNSGIRASLRANLTFDRLARAEGAGLGRRSLGEGGYADTQVGTDADPCSGRYNDRDDDYYQHCEVRDSSMPAGPLNVDAGQNGGISVEAWDRSEIRVRAIVRANARGDGRAKEIASQVQIQAGGGRVYATGPDLERREWWSVSYRINVPRKNDLDLSAVNGGVTIAGVSGNLRFDTTNGGVRLTDVGGRVNGETRNGGLNVTLAGSRWEGEGLDVETSNGGVTLAIPEGYNAELETRTVNGGLRIDFPITIQDELSSRRGISTTLGSGGPLVRVRTTNGGVKINRR